MRTYLLFVSIMLCQVMRAQPCRPPDTRTWLHVQNREGFVDTLWFGFDSTATYGFDFHLCEFELPPIPPSCPWWLPRFGDIPGRDGLGLGTWHDYRDYVSHSQIDTHRAFFGSLDSACGSGNPTTLRWSSSSVVALSDSAVIIDRSWGFHRRVRMDLVDSIVITDPNVTSLLIFKYGAKITPVHVSEETRLHPYSTLLYQNHPNPFNPSTTITYVLAHPSHATLEVLDVLGRVVSSVVNELQPPGEHWVTFDAGHLNSGVYFYRLSTGEFIQTRKMMVVK